MKLSYSIAQDVATFSTIGLVSVSWASTTQPTIPTFAALRLGFVAIILLFFIWGLAKFPFKAGTVLAGSSLMVLSSCYSILMLGSLAPTSASNITSYLIWVVLSSSIAGVYYLTPAGKPVVSDRATWMFIGFASLVLGYTVAEGGLLISGFPRFVFDLKVSGGDDTISYSQGISKFFGLAAVFSATLLSRSETKWQFRCLCVGLLAVFLPLSLIGGGRGDFVFALLTSILALRKVHLAAFLLALSLIGMVYSSKIQEALSAYYILFDRFSALSYSFGMRDTLLFDSLNLLFDKPNCLAIGCGIGFFQSHYNYLAGFHPHNVLIETLISFGLVTTLALLIIAVYGQRRMRELHGKSPNFRYMIVFFSLISFKSGTILTSFLLCGGFALLALHGFTRFRTNKLEKAKLSARF